MQFTEVYLIVDNTATVQTAQMVRVTIEASEYDLFTIIFSSPRGLTGAVFLLVGQRPPG